MLQIEDLNKTYPDGTRALNNINLKIKKGIFGLVGPNGAGKSTLMRIIATLMMPDSGEIKFENIDVLYEKEKIRSILGYLPQEFGLYPNVSAESLLDYLAVLKGFNNRKTRRKTVDYLLDITNLSQYSKKKLGKFSGGMKQRFGIAQALLGQPKLIIVDELTAGLDPSERYRFHNFLSAISENILVIFSTHIVADVNELCNDMAIINEGKILIQQSPYIALNLLQNKVWNKIISKEEFEFYTQKYKVIISKFIHGNIMIKVFDEVKPNGFEATLPDFEDVYFSYIKSYIKIC